MEPTTPLLHLPNLEGRILYSAVWQEESNQQENRGRFLEIMLIY